MERKFKKMQRHTPLGYRIVDGKAEIVPETAQIVIAVFEEYLDGASTNRIAKNLTEQGVLNASHRPSWNHGSVGKILENTKYMGDGFYPPLIEQAKFEQVQHRRQNKVVNLGRTAQLNSFANTVPFSGKLYCGICGEPYRRYVEHSRQTGETIRWKCKHYIWKNRVCCRNTFLTDKQIENSFIQAINCVIAMPVMLEQCRPKKTSESIPTSEGLTRQIQQAFETGRYNTSEIKRLLFERAAEQYRSGAIDDWQHQTDKLKVALDGRTKQIIFDEGLFIATVKKIVIYADGRLRLYLYNGLQIENSITEKMKEDT